jgi:hypothetical protein
VAEAVGPASRTLADAHAGEQLHRRRFSVAYVFLALLACCSLAALFVVVTGKRPGEGPKWSAWSPSADGAAGAEEIAAYIAPRYRLDTGQQIVGVQASQPVFQNISIEVIGISNASTTGLGGTGYRQAPGANSMMYLLCGFGESCSIAFGTPSAERLELLRREALELALYTFKYIHDRDSVIVFLPPQPGAKPTGALFFQKADFQTELSQPLSHTLDPNVPKASALSDDAEGRLIDELTADRRYHFTFQQLKDGNAALVLDPSPLAP